jgi:hypothetical protein
MKKTLKIIGLGFLVVLMTLIVYLFWGPTTSAQNIAWGVDFSQKHAQSFGLDWHEAYLALLQDLQVKNLKLSTAWDLLEQEPGKYNFDDLDWQIIQTGGYGAKVILVIGMKTPRWPECHLPAWAKNLPNEKLQEAVLKLLDKIVSRYGNDQTIWAWQVENEPLLSFGECPKADKNFLKKEVELVKNLDPLKRPVIISDSGEWSFWFEASKLGDIVGTTMYRRTWFNGFSLDYPFSPLFYAVKTKIIDRLFHKKVICIELQAEPWGSELLYDLPLPEQKKLMTIEGFRGNLEFATKTGLDTFYLWGGEWWYWLKEKHNDPSFWEEARKIFNQ